MRLRPKISTVICSISCFLSSGVLILGSPADDVRAPANLRAAVDGAISRMRPALVRIRVVFTEYREGRELKTQAVGSGAIITKDGYVVTNHHVAGHAARLICTLWNREEVEADLVGTDPLTDISVIKLRPEKPRSFETASFGDSSKMEVGDSVLAMGSPMALSQSVTLGIISNGEMIMPKIFIHVSDPDATEEEQAALAQAVSARPTQCKPGDEITVVVSVAVISPLLTR